MNSQSQRLNKTIPKELINKCFRKVMRPDLITVGHLGAGRWKLSKKQNQGTEIKGIDYHIPVNQDELFRTAKCLLQQFCSGPTGM